MSSPVTFGSIIIEIPGNDFFHSVDPVFRERKTKWRQILLRLAVLISVLLSIFRNHIWPVHDDLKQWLKMSAQEMTAELDGKRSREEKQQSSVTENEEQFKGPRFYPPVYRRRYAAVSELVKKHQAKRVWYLLCFRLLFSVLYKNSIIFKQIVKIGTGNNTYSNSVFLSVHGTQRRTLCF